MEDPENLDLLATDLVRDDEGASRNNEFARATAAPRPTNVGKVARQP
jgi:hypothetical protein